MFVEVLVMAAVVETVIVLILVRKTVFVTAVDGCRRNLEQNSEASCSAPGSLNADQLYLCTAQQYLRTPRKGILGFIWIHCYC
jgi:hypothetical protein